MKPGVPRRPRPPQVPPVEESPEDLVSRTDRKKERQRVEDELMRLAAALADLPERSFARIELPDHVRTVLAEARRVTAHGARNRALRLVRTALRDSDTAAIERAFRRRDR